MFEEFRTSADLEMEWHTFSEATGEALDETLLDMDQRDFYELRLADLLSVFMSREGGTQELTHHWESSRQPTSTRR